MKIAKGFTLVELILVVAILSIMAVAALPQFINFSSDAERGRIKALAGALKSATDIVYAKANVKSLHEAAVTCLGGKIDTATETCPDGGLLIHFGYPAASENVLKQVITLDDWVTSSVSAGLPGGIRIAATDKDITACYVHYEEATLGSEAEIEFNTDGC
ncbi:type II secretion system protein [Idiomarina sp. HP20-50]|uniref:type II secretion system protein n=1 Tax=Idiomarina sp. HP20-50 TaxID=3070813 RepID=UPI00294B4586|nr:type II secretion system protein [Idiomarina sp. HP20-50]MDV6316369.1 type II secretion system protein [Idiomarina sp. HP20-50]